MSKLFNEPVLVHTNKTSAPDAFIWRKRLYRIKGILSWWREPAAWWDGEYESLFLRVRARHSTDGVYELYRNGEQWFLQRLVD